MKTFSATSRSGKSIGSCWTTAMPRAWACVGERSSITSPPTFTTPASGLWIPARIFTSVLLPAPFSPTSACTSPGNRRKSTPRKACTPPNCLAIPLSSTIGSGEFVTFVLLLEGKLDELDSVQYNYWGIETFQLFQKKILRCQKKNDQ